MASRSGRRSTLGLLAVAAMILGPTLATVGLVPPLVGFVAFALGGLLAIGVAIASLVQAARGHGLSTGGGAALAAAVLFMILASRGSDAPRINDFTTDLADPPAFRHAATLPANQGRSMAYPSEFARIQGACCQDLVAYRLSADPAAAFARARRVAEAMPSWVVTQADPADGTIEVVVTSRIFRFQDDVVIRVRGDGAGRSIVDVRSKSRDGKGDLGANAARIREYLRAFAAAP
jgi:uncharacterized protein (DUF1499 family)